MILIDGIGEDNVKKIKEFLKNNYSIIIDVLYYIYFIIAIGVKIFYLQFTTGLNTNAMYYHDVNVNTMRAAISIILMIFAVLFVAFKKRRNGAMFIANVILSMLFLADTLYFRYYKLPISVSLLYQIKLIGDTSGSIMALFKIKDIVYFIDLPIYFIVKLIKKLLKKKYSEKIIKRRYAFVTSAIVLGVSILMFNQFYSNANTELHAYDRNYAAKDLSILYYHYYDFKTFLQDEIERRKPLTDEEKTIVEQYFNEKNKNKVQNPEYNSIAKDRNLIIVQVEALQNFVIGNTINGQEITPFLNNLVDESVYCENIYNQVAGGNTCDAEFLVNNSLYPIGSGAVYFRYPRNLYYSLPSKLRDLGYSTTVAHAFKPSFWNRQIFYNNVGFETFYSLNDFVEDEIVGWAVSDKSFFKQTMDKIDMNEKFYSFNITLSSHHPYDAFFGFENLDVGKYEGKQLGNYLKGANYVDSALESLFDLLKEKGVYDNSVIVIYGDHSGIFEDQSTDLCEYLGIEYNEFEWKKLQQIPVIIHVPGENLVKRVSNVGGEIDILPTIANLMGIDMPYMMGKDMLNIPNDDGYAVLRYSSVITDNYMYLSDSKTFYDMKTGDKIDASLNMDDLNKKLNELKISDIIINKDYFRKMNK